MSHTNNYTRFFCLLMILLAGCTTPAQTREDLAQRAIRVVATTGMVADVVHNVGGLRVQVDALMGPGVDPHLYKASEGDLHVLDKADVIFYSGLHLEAGMAHIFERMKDWKPVVAVTDQIPREKLLAPPEFSGAYDPHVWFDVQMWKYTVPAVRDTLAEIDPANTALYRRNADAYMSELDDLDNFIRQQVAQIPPTQRVLITAHDAFNYFGRAYGFEVRGLQGISTVSEAGTSDVQALAGFISDRQIRAIFVESSVPRRTVEAVQAAVRARGFPLVIGGELYSDALGSTGSLAATYTGMVRHNVVTIANALVEGNTHE